MGGLFIQGEHGVGKSTLLHGTLCGSGVRYMGYYTQRVIAGECTMGFAVRPVHTGNHVQLTVAYTPALEQSMFILREGDSFIAHPQRFLEVAIPVLRSAPSTRAALIVLDELGGIELLSEEFRAVLFDTVKRYPVVGTFKCGTNASKLQKKTNIDSYWLTQYRQLLLDGFPPRGVAIDTLDSYNRENVKTRLTALLDEVKENYGKRL